MGPHAPIAFEPAGELRSGWPCIPDACSVFYDGEYYGDAQTVAIAREVTAIDRMVVDAARTIRAASARPPVVVFLSDHGSRFDPADRDEMLRSFFLAATPGPPRAVPRGRDAGQPRAEAARRVRRHRSPVCLGGVVLAPARGRPGGRAAVVCPVAGDGAPGLRRVISAGSRGPGRGAANGRGTPPSTSAGSAGATSGA